MIVRLPNWWKTCTRPRLNVTIGSVKQKKLGADALLDFNLWITLGEETLTERKLQALLAAREGLVSTAGNNNPLSPRPANVQQRTDATGST